MQIETFSDTKLYVLCYDEYPQIYTRLAKDTSRYDIIEWITERQSTNLAAKNKPSLADPNGEKKSNSFMGRVKWILSGMGVIAMALLIALCQQQVNQFSSTPTVTNAFTQTPMFETDTPIPTNLPTSTPTVTPIMTATPLPTNTPTLTPTQRSDHFCGTVNFTVNANKITDTQLTIAKGSSVQARATGEGIKFSFDLGPGYGPSGEKRIAQSPFPGENLHEYALLTQIGLDWYEIGSGATFTVKNEGTLRLQFNDWQLDDNSGTAEVVITIQCP